MSIDLSSKTPEISVIIPHYNQPEALNACLASVAAQTFGLSRMEIIVADNNSPGDLTALKKAYPSVKFINAAERGAAPARNAGMKAARGGVFAFIDADCVADRRWLENGVAALSACDLSGGAVTVTAKDASARTPVESFERIFAFNQRRYINRKYFSVTANLIVSRKVALAVGLFRNGVSEDVDWCRRARALGFRLAFNDTSIISHPARRSWEDLTVKWDRLIKERWNGFGGRNLARRLIWAGLAIATALSAAPHMTVILFSRRVNKAQDKIAAAGVLARIRLWRAWRMLALLQSATSSGR